MKTQNVAKVKESMNALVDLKANVTSELDEMIRTLAEMTKQLEVILTEEENQYAEQHKQKKDVVVIYDEKLNALFEAIGILERKVVSVEQAYKRIDDAIELLIVVTQ